MTTLTSPKVADLVNEVYQSEGIGFETDDRLDEIVAQELSDAGIEIDEEAADGFTETEYARPFVRRAVCRWADELSRESGNE